MMSSAARRAPSHWYLGIDRRFPQLPAAFDLAAARHRTPDAVGKAIVYARRPSALGDTRSWLLDPDVRDISPPGTRFARREPICTIFARRRDAAACFGALARRAVRLYRDVEHREAQSA